jgi:translation initiation factor 2 beta subunit (eIF-2beta)/eIF-5
MSYSERLDIIYDKLNSRKDDYQVHLGEVNITERKFFKNAKQILKPFKRPPDHIINFIGTEMKCSVNWISSNKNDGLIFSSNVNSKNVTNILVKYINRYIKCNYCKSTNTKYKYNNKKAGLYCRNCKSEYTID